jgi:hypothetical protein
MSTTIMVGIEKEKAEHGVEGKLAYYSRPCLSLEQAVVQAQGAKSFFKFASSPLQVSFQTLK